MEATEILEGNKIIAEFMDWRIAENIKHESGEPTYIKKENLGTSYATMDMMAYHKSWNWLMPVVEKIEVIEISRNHNPVVTIEKYITIISDNGEAPIVESQTDSRIEGAYNAVVKFIKWYNQQSK